MRYPLDKNIQTLQDIPYTISYIIRKRQQIDSLMELEDSKRPSDEMIYDGTSEELDNWLKRVISGKESSTVDLVFSEFEVER